MNSKIKILEFHWCLSLISKYLKSLVASFLSHGLDVLVLWSVDTFFFFFLLSFFLLLLSFFFFFFFLKKKKKKRTLNK
jgi:hypothetical protein